MIILYRFLPILSAIFISSVFKIQFQKPFSYPYWLVIGISEVILAIFLMSRKRIKIKDLTEKMLPTLLLLFSLGFGSLLVENSLERWVIIVLSGVSTFLSMELLFFYIFSPSRYPMHGLSRVNIAYVPFIIWYTVYTSIGLMTFLHTSNWIHVILMVILSILLFRTTGHPEATPQENKIWMLVGGITGFYLGLLGIVLPLSMSSQGALSMILFAIALRLRRFLYKPLPNVKQIWAEAIIGFASFVLIIITSRWL